MAVGAKSTGEVRWRTALRHAAALALLALGFHARAVELGGSTALVSDYVFRGVSQTGGRAAVQAGVTAGLKGGFYALVWGSSVEFDDMPQVHTELDYGLGWSGALGEDWTIDVCLTRYTYANARELAYAEWAATATWRDRAWVSVGYSPDTFNAGERAEYGQVGVRVPIGERWRAEGAVGRYRLDNVLGEAYSHAQIGVVWSDGGNVELRLTGHHTDDAARRLFPELAGSRLAAEAVLEF